MRIEVKEITTTLGMTCILYRASVDSKTYDFWWHPEDGITPLQYESAKTDFTRDEKRYAEVRAAIARLLINPDEDRNL